MPESFDVILTNPPFSMKYDSSKEDESRIIEQYSELSGESTVKSSVLFITRYCKLLRPGGEILIVLDDTVLNGKSFANTRKWILEKFIILGIHSLPFNAFFKAKANIKTSILHLRKKSDSGETQGNVFMSITNNIGHDNATNDTPMRNNLNEILMAYLEWKRTGKIEPKVIENQDKNENLECPMQYWLTPPEKFRIERFDSFFYCPDLANIYGHLDDGLKTKKLCVIEGKSLKLREKLTRVEKKRFCDQKKVFRYFEIGDVTRYGLITKCIEGTFDELPSRGEYQVKHGDVLLALNNSSRGTVVIVPKEFDGAICTSGFLVIIPTDEEQRLLLWYSLRGEICRKQIYYLAQTASQPELKIEAWNQYYKIPLPKGASKKKALEKAKEFMSCLHRLSNIDEYSFS